MNEFLLSDESLNSHGVIIVTDGIRLGRFLKNPVMFYNHDKGKGIAGRWDNVRVEDNKMYGTPVFDDSHEPGKTAKEQAESGFLKGASIGIDNIEYEYDLHGKETSRVISCELIEVSVCDIPSNRNTLQLYYNDKPVDFSTYKQLSLNNKRMNEHEFKTVLQALGLPDTATVKDVLKSIDGLKEPQEENPNKALRLAYKQGIVTNTEQHDMEMLLGDNPEKLALYVKQRKLDFEKSFPSEFEELMRDNSEKFNFEPLSEISNELKELAKQNFPLFKKFLSCVRGKKRVLNYIEQEGSKGQPTKLRSCWTLDDYRKNDPQELRRNPQLYKSLLEREQYNK